MPPHTTPKKLPEYLLSRGRHAATTEEIAELLELKREHVRQGLARLRSQRKVFSPARGLWIFIPPAYQSWGVLPAEQFVDEMMGFLGKPYYVALLSAAAMHGAAHQRPQVFQVMSDGRVEDRDLGRVRLRFYRNRLTEQVPVESKNTPTGTIDVSTKEATALDLVARPQASGGLSNVATVLVELGPLDGEELARLASPYPRSLARRLGWMVDNFSEETDTSRLASIASPSTGGPARLSGSGSRRGPIDSRWGLWLNSNVEPDL